MSDRDRFGGDICNLKLMNLKKRYSEMIQENRDIKETKPKVSKYYAYYKLWVDVNRQRNKAIYLLFINCNIKRSDLAKIFSVSTTRIKQIIDKQERINRNLKKEIMAMPDKFIYFDSIKEAEKKVSAVIKYWDNFIKYREKEITKTKEKRNFLILKLKKLKQGQIVN
jgi:hypothetical protein